jgi:hypothetical protein
LGEPEQSQRYGAVGYRRLLLLLPAEGSVHGRNQMSARAFFSAIVFCAALLGCATSPFGVDVRTLRCTGQNCDVQVAVSCSLGLFCTASVDHETVQVSRGNSPNITWQMISPGYAFPSNGIVFASGGTQFDCHVEANGRRFACRDRNTAPGKFKYTVNVTGSPAVPPLDPFVSNE